MRADYSGVPRFTLRILFFHLRELTRVSLLCCSRDGNVTAPRLRVGRRLVPREGLKAPLQRCSAPAGGKMAGVFFTAEGSPQSCSKISRRKK